MGENYFQSTWFKKHVEEVLSIFINRVEYKKLDKTSETFCTCRAFVLKSTVQSFHLLFRKPSRKQQD